MIIQESVVEKANPGICPPMVFPSKSVGVKESGFPIPPVMPVMTEKSVSSDLVFSRRDVAKLEWTNPVESEEGSSLRYNFDGNLISIDKSQEYKSELFHHGLEPGCPGYTLEELFHLSQSGFQSQKALAVKAIGKIAQRAASKGRKSKREFHRTLLGEWKSHLRFSVACSDTSLNVRTSAWGSLLQLIECLDKECGCIVFDLASIPEFWKSFLSDDINSVKVFLYIINAFESSSTDDVTSLKQKVLTESVIEAAKKLNLNPSEFLCGAPEAAQLLTHMVKEEDAPAAEVIATLCDRIACISSEPLPAIDIDLFHSLLKTLQPSTPFFDAGVLDEFSWTSRTDMVIKAMTEFTGKTSVSVFLAKFCWLFTSSLFPIECRAAIWANTDLLANISRLLIAHDQSGINLLGNQDEIDFTCSDIKEVTRENALIVRAIKNACTKFIDSEADEANLNILNTAKHIVSRLGNS